jgi:hypothetical protein
VTRQIENTVRGDLEPLLVTVVAALKHDPGWAGAGRGQLVGAVAAALAARGVAAELDAPLRAGGRAELLLTIAGRSGQKVAVLTAVEGATDALRARVRALAAHREIAAVVIASPRARHRALAGDLGAVAVRVALLPPPPRPDAQHTGHPAPGS